MIVKCATFSKSLNPRNIDKNVSDIRIRIRLTFEISFWISVSGCKLTILPDIQPANRIMIISAVHLCNVVVFSNKLWQRTSHLIEHKAGKSWTVLPW